MGMRSPGYMMAASWSDNLYFIRCGEKLLPVLYRSFGERDDLVKTAETLYTLRDLLDS